MLKVRFLDTSMPKPFKSHIFMQILREHFDPNVKLVENQKEVVDLEFVSNNTTVSDLEKILLRIKAKYNSDAMITYKNRFRSGFRPYYKTRTRKRVWFTGENLRAPLEHFDLTFSFDKTDPLIHNVFFPYWFYQCNWFDEISRDKIEQKIENLLIPRVPVNREKIAVTFSTHFEQSRARIVKAMQHVIKVDCFGQYFHKHVDSKVMTSANYGLQICNENDLYPDYVTEKLLEAWSSRNVPVWAGLDQSGYFNPEAIINVTSLTTSEISERINSITIDEIMYRQSLPLLVKEPKLDEAIGFLAKLLN
jgi:Glycosyltransferase family 10 (fucosyltransferase) C-term